MFRLCSLILSPHFSSPVKFIESHFEYTNAALDCSVHPALDKRMFPDRALSAVLCGAAAKASTSDSPTTPAPCLPRAVRHTHTHTHRVSERERDRQNFTECKSHGHFFTQTAQSFLRTKTDAPRGAPRRLVEHPDDGELQPRPADRSTWEARPDPGAPGQHVPTPLKQSCCPATHPAVI